MTITDAAEALGITKGTVHRRVQSGKYRTVAVERGGRKLIEVPAQELTRAQLTGQGITQESALIAELRAEVSTLTELLHLADSRNDRLMSLLERALPTPRA